MALITINRTIVQAAEAAAGPAGPSRRRRVAIGLAVVGLAGLSASIGQAVASPSGGSTTNVSFVTLSPAFKLFTNKAFAAHLNYPAVVIGGSTKVPTNATTIELQVTATGKAAGTMNFYPAGNLTGGSGQALVWNANETVSATIEENVGTANELTFANGTTAATATATIVGYSTQVTAGDVSPADGSNGQVLTNTGTGAIWQNLPAALPPSGAAGGALTGAYPNPALGSAVVGHANLQNGAVSNQNISAAGGTPGQVLTNTATGAAWQTTGQLYASSKATDAITGGLAVVDSVTVPAGTYLVSDTFITNTATPDLVGCSLLLPSGTISANTLAPTTYLYPGYGYYGSASTQAAVTTSGGTISLRCLTYSEITGGSVLNETLTAAQVNAVHGTVLSIAPQKIATGQPRQNP